MNAPDYALFLDVAEGVAAAGAAAVRPRFRRPLKVDIKPDGSFVSAADREAETAMRRVIESAYPEHGIIGEEQAAVRVEAAYVWVLDPIDGSGAFLSGQPTFSVLVALLHRGRPVLGVIEQPITGERWCGVAGQATTLNGEVARARPCAALSRAVLYATSPEMFAGSDGEAFQRLRRRVGSTRYGLDGYAYGLLASGFIDLVAEAALAAHDFCALVPVVEGAGGVMTDWEGVPLGLRSKGRVLAVGDRRLQGEALSALAGAAAGGSEPEP